MSRLAAVALDIKCKICTCILDEDEDDNFEDEVCASCLARPEGRRLKVVKQIQPIPSAAGQSQPTYSKVSKPARGFTPADKSMISKLKGYMPQQQLLDILNERLLCDLGPDATPYNMDQLYTEIGDAPSSVKGGELDWAELRKLLAKARRSGLLAQIDEQLINDFAVVYSLNNKQVMTLKDIILEAKKEQE